MVGIIEWEDPGIPHIGVSLSSQVIKRLAGDLLLEEKRILCWGLSSVTVP